MRWRAPVADKANSDNVRSTILSVVSVRPCSSWPSSLSHGGWTLSVIELIRRGDFSAQERGARNVSPGKMAAPIGRSIATDPGAIRH